MMCGRARRSEDVCGQVQQGNVQHGRVRLGKVRKGGDEEKWLSLGEST